MKKIPSYPKVSASFALFSGGFMSGRFCLLLALLAPVLGGCATVSEERISVLEAAVLDLQTTDMRLASLEDTVAALVARHPLSAAEPAPKARPGFTAGPEPRRVQPEPRAVAVLPPPVPASVPAPASEPAPASRKAPAPAARLYQAALSALEAGRPGSALGQFQEFLRAYPDHALAPNAGYWLGECYYSQKQYDSAIIAFKDVVALHSGHDKAAAAMLKAGYSYALLGDAANARFYLEALIKDYPSSQPASLARIRLVSL